MGNFYKATSAKNPDRNYTEEVVLEKDNKGEVTKSVRVGGEPVELTDEERAKVARYLNVRQATDEEKDVAEGDVSNPPTDSEQAEAQEQQLSTTPGVNPPDSPAAAEARSELGRKRRGGE